MVGHLRRHGGNNGGLIVVELVGSDTGERAHARAATIGAN